ncbi:MAG: SpaA isopeptide-forming pilin-related protein, partial [Oscillospiraceae bacterium]
MKSKVKAFAIVFMALLLCLQPFVGAASNLSDDLTHTGAAQAGYPAIIAGGAHLPISSFYLASTAAGSQLEAYSADSASSAVVGHHYSVINLEDAFFGAANAKKLRTILLNSYPFTSLSSIQTASGLQILTPQEAISAAQLAVWYLTNGTAYDPYVSPDIGEASRVRALRDWYMTQPDTAPLSTIANIAIQHSFETNGSLNIAYRATQPNIPLTCTLSPNVASTTQPLDSQGFAHTIVPNPPASLVASVSGSQSVSRDAFFYAPHGGRSAAQSMAGVTSGTIALKNTVTIECPPISGGGIKIIKIDSATGNPLPGVEFLISQNANFSNPVYTVTTDASGIALKTGLAAGTWYVKEVAPPSGYMPITEVFTVVVGTAIVELDVKNTPYSGIKILKVDENNLPLAGGVFSIYAGSSATGTPLYKGGRASW